MSRLTAAVLMAFLLAGCVGPQIITNTDSAVSPSFPSGSTFAVLSNADAAQNPIFDSRVKEKIETLIRARGHELAENPDYIVSYGYDVDANRELNYRPVYRRVPVPVVVVGGSHGVTRPLTRWGYDYDLVTYVPEMETTYVPRALIRVVNAQKTGTSEEVVWIGEAYANTDDANLEKWIDPLLAAAFRNFGQDTPGPQSLRLSPEEVQAAFQRQTPTSTADPAAH